MKKLIASLILALAAAAQAQFNTGGENTVSNLAPQTAITASVTNSALDLRTFSGSGLVLVTYTNTTDTTNTLTVRIESSADSSTWATLTTGSQITNTTGGVQSIPVAPDNRYIRAVSTLTGGTANFNRGINYVGHKSSY